MAAFEVIFSIIKLFIEKKVNAEINFALISLFHVKIQNPATRSTSTKAFALQNLLLKNI